MLGLREVGVQCEKGERKENQDHCFQLECGKEGESKVLVVGVLDGHGSNGRVCAQKTSELFEKSLAAPDSAVVAAIEQPEEAMAALQDKLFESVHQSIVELSEDKTSTVSARFSGTTVALVLLRHPHLCVANVGDSDVVLGTSTTGDDGVAHMAPTMLNVRHQLTNEQEKERVIAAGGRVETQRGRNGEQLGGPLRVWLKEIQTPGLMVSRSIGDLVCHDIGVSAKPATVVRQLVPEDRLLIMGSDGLWEFVSLQEAVDFVEDFADPLEASAGLTKMALSRQTPRNADNCSVIVIFLEPLDVRRARLEARPGWQAAYEGRLAEIENFKKAIEKGPSSPASGAPAKPGEGPGGPAAGSIIYGAPQAGSIVDTGEEYEEEEKKAKAKKESKACVIS